jgi:DNA helicase II / ATP-dependent DNA helicase PcrA
MKTHDYESIVTNYKQPILVLAGPGAGKTYLIGDRIKRLIESGISEKNITVLTFGRDASLNLKSKLLDAINGFSLPYDKLPNISTMHSLGFEILNRNLRHFDLLKENLRILDDDKIKNLLFRDAALCLALEKDIAIKALGCKINGNCQIDNEKDDCQICLLYRKIMSYCNYIDYDDQILLALELLERDPNLLKEYQNKSEHLLVDEYQDINAAQFKLIELLSRKSRTGLFAVGDDAQSIYGFRGGTPDYILKFKEHFSDAFTPPLNHSRRCPENIIKDAEKVLLKYYNTWSGPFKLTYHVTDGEEPKIIQVKSEKAEAELVASISLKALNEKRSVLILVPKKSFFRQISYTLSKFGVPHLCPTNLLSPWSYDRILTISKLMNWVQDPDDNFKTRVAMETLLNHGNTRISGGKITKNIKKATIQKRFEIETELAQLWTKVTRKNNLFSALLSLTKISKELEKIKASLQQLLELYKNVKTDGEFILHLVNSSEVWIVPEKFTEDFTGIINILDTSPSLGFNCVQLMTMRKAKGLEADVVIMVGLEDDIIPSNNAPLSEESRLFYVSMTRAKKTLYLIHSYRRPRYISFGPDLTAKRRSRFVEAIGRKSQYNK